MNRIKTNTEVALAMRTPAAAQSLATLTSWVGSFVIRSQRDSIAELNNSSAVTRATQTQRRPAQIKLGRIIREVTRRARVTKLWVRKLFSFLSAYEIPSKAKLKRLKKLRFFLGFKETRF